MFRRLETHIKHLVFLRGTFRLDLDEDSRWPVSAVFIYDPASEQRSVCRSATPTLRNVPWGFRPNHSGL